MTSGWQYDPNQPGGQGAGSEYSAPYGQPSADAYGQPSFDPYGQPSATPYSQPSADPYGQTGYQDTQSYDAAGYSQPYAQPQPYQAQPYQPQMNPYATPYQAAWGPGMMIAGAPYGVEPGTGMPYSEKSKVVAGVLQLFLGGLGVGRFYKGDVGIGIAQLLLCVFFGWWLFFPLLWPLVDGIVMLCTRQTDSNGLPMRG